MSRQIIAIGGSGLTCERKKPKLIEYFVSQIKSSYPKICFIGTAHGDADIGRLQFYNSFSQFNCKLSYLPLFERTPVNLKDFILSHDAIYIGGGNTRSMLALWREWDIDKILKIAWEKGVLLGGESAGAICWYESGITDSIEDEYSAINCLGFISGSSCPHYHLNLDRRKFYHSLILKGEINRGIAIDDGVALHYTDSALTNIISISSNLGAWIVREKNKQIEEKLLDKF